MEKFPSHSGLLLASALSVVIAFLLASRKARRYYGHEDITAINAGWLVVLLSSAPLLLHLAITKSGSEVVAIASSPELALTATLIAFLGVMELCGAFAINHSMRIKPERVQIIAAYVLLLFGAGLVSSVSQFNYEAGSWVSAFWNACLMAWAVTGYFATGGLVRLATARQERD